MVAIRGSSSPSAPTLPRARWRHPATGSFRAQSWASDAQAISPNTRDGFAPGSAVRRRSNGAYPLAARVFSGQSQGAPSAGVGYQGKETCLPNPTATARARLRVAIVVGSGCQHWGDAVHRQQTAVHQENGSGRGRIGPRLVVMSDNYSPRRTCCSWGVVQATVALSRQNEEGSRRTWARSSIT